MSGERGRGWGAVEILLLLALTVIGLPLAVREYDTPPAPVERQADFEKQALQLLDFAGNDVAYHVRSSKWVNNAATARPVSTLAAARKSLENSRQLEIKLARPFPRPFSLKALYDWVTPYKVRIDTAGRVRELDLHYDLSKPESLDRAAVDMRQYEKLANAVALRVSGGKPEAAARTEVNAAAEQSARERARAFAAQIDLRLIDSEDSRSGERNAERETVYREGLFHYVKYHSERSGESCLLVAMPERVAGFHCGEKRRRGESESLITSWFVKNWLVFAAGSLRLLTLLLFAAALVRRLIRDEWDLGPSLKAGMIIAGLVLLAWPWPLEIRLDLLLWPIAALIAFVVTAATLAAFLSAIRADNEEAAAAFEGLVTRRLFTRDVLSAVGEGALGALALIGFMALTDVLLFRLGWPHVPFMPDPSQYESAVAPIHWFHELRWAALHFPLALMVIWLFHRISLWFPQLAGRIFGALYAGIALGALMGVNGSVAAIAGVALGFLLFVRRYSSGGLLALVSAAFCWHLVPLALRLPPMGHGGTSAVMAALTLAALIALGVWGWLRAPSLSSGEVYVPGYVNRTRESNRLQRELEIARSVQLRFLPETAPVVPGVEIAFHCTPAMEVGGDYFDFLERAGALDVVVGDVSGKGVASAFYMTLAKGILHTLTRLDLAPDEVVRRLNVIFHANSPQGVFLTLAYASMNLETRRMVYFRAGHNSCLVRRASGRVERLMPPGMIIGFDAGPRFNAGLGSAVIDLAPGDCVLLYTDGASEAMNSRSEEFGEARLSDALAGCSGSASEVLQAAEAAVVAFCAGERQRDDLTLLVLKITG